MVDQVVLDEAKVVLGSLTPEEKEHMNDCVAVAFVNYVADKEDLSFEAAAERCAEICASIDTRLQEDVDEAVN